MFTRQRFRRTAKITSALMIASVLVPTLAFAAPHFGSVTYDQHGTVSGSVYYDKDDTVTDNVYVNVHDLDGNTMGDGVIQATYDHTDTNGLRYYKFNESIASNNSSPIELQVQGSSVTDEVYAKDLYRVTGNLNLSGVSTTGTTITIKNNDTSWSQSLSYGDSVTTDVYGSNDVNAVDADTLQYYFSVPEGHYSIQANNGSYSDTVTYTTYKDKADQLSIGPNDYFVNTATDLELKDNSSSGSTGSGGYIPPYTSVDGTTINAGSNGSISVFDLQQAFSAGKDVTVKISGDSATLPAEALIEAAKTSGATVTIQNDLGSYTLPLSVLDFDSLAKSADTDKDNLSIKVTIKAVDDDTNKAIESVAAGQGASLEDTPITYGLEVLAPGGKTITIDDFGKTYVTRTITLNKELDSSQSTVALYDQDSKSLRFVPSTFSKDAATFMRTGNSIYAVVHANKSFVDVPSSLYAAKDIQVLTNKLVISGENDTHFAPDRSITRAEFAGLIVRSLGLNVDSIAKSSFSDVPANTWYAPEVAAAVKAGIIYGYPDGTFRPNATIDRDELAAMVVRAMKFAGKEVKLTAAQQASLLGNYRDASTLGWAKEEMAIAIQSHIVYGMTAHTLVPNGTATRAQAAAMLKRYLDNVDFIN